MYVCMYVHIQIQEIAFEQYVLRRDTTLFKLTDFHIIFFLLIRSGPFNPIDTHLIVLSKYVKFRGMDVQYCGNLF